MFTIAAVWSGSQGRTSATLSRREIFVGRSRKCDLVLREETVSAVHCRLVAIEGGVIVMDEGSTNGTWLNDTLVVQPTLMTADDELRVGPYSLRVQSLVGGASAALARRRAERGRALEQPAEPAPSPRPTARPATEEPVTPLQVPQAQVFWRILGFQEGASLEEARAAYQALAQQYTQEAQAQQAPEAQAVAKQRLREIEFAWEYLQRLCQKAQAQDAA